MAKYSVNQEPVENLLTYIKSGEIAIPEIQRPFVWSASKVRDLIDSLYKGYPVGYIITWKNPDVKLKNRDISMGKKVLIDGQQRITALSAAIVGQRVLNKNYKENTIQIAFNPLTEKFDVLNRAYEKSPQWINSIHPIVNEDISISKARRDYVKDNPEVDEEFIEDRIEKLKEIRHKQIGIIELAHSLDIDTVTEIFIRINQKGVVLSNADFVMSKIASDEHYGGTQMRKLVDYFCRLIVDKDFNKHIQDNDTHFASNGFYNDIRWMANASDQLYIPDYIDVLRVAFTYKFSRGKFSDLVALLSGRNFETRAFESKIAENSYNALTEGLRQFVNKTNYERFLMLVQSAGFVNYKLISSKNSFNFSYALYLKLKEQSMPEPDIQHYVKRWLVLALLTGRYSGSAESKIDEDIKQLDNKGVKEYLYQREQSALGEGFWAFGLVNDLETSSTNNNAYNVYLAAQCQQNARAFLAADMTIKSLIEQRGDVHHIFPKNYLDSHGFKPKMYNQVANYVFTEQFANIKIGKVPPRDYLERVRQEIMQEKRQITSLTNEEELYKNLQENDIPEMIFEAEESDFETFLNERRKLMAQKIKTYYENL